MGVSENIVGIVCPFMQFCVFLYDGNKPFFCAFRSL